MRVVFGIDECMDSVHTQARAMDRTVCNLFLFPKKPYCYCYIMKSLMLY